MKTIHKRVLQLCAVTMLLGSHNLFAKAEFVRHEETAAAKAALGAIAAFDKLDKIVDAGGKWTTGAEGVFGQIKTIEAKNPQLAKVVKTTLAKIVLFKSVAAWVTGYLTTCKNPVYAVPTAAELQQDLMRAVSMAGIKPSVGVAAAGSITLSNAGTFEFVLEVKGASAFNVILTAATNFKDLDSFIAAVTAMVLKAASAIVWVKGQITQYKGSFLLFYNKVEIIDIDGTKFTLKTLIEETARILAFIDIFAVDAVASATDSIEAFDAASKAGSVARGAGDTSVQNTTTETLKDVFIGLEVAAIDADLDATI